MIRVDKAMTGPWILVKPLMEHGKMDSNSVHKEDKHQRKQVACENCDRTFSGNHCLKRHVKSIHEGKSPMCIDCGKSFSSKANLITHLKRNQESRDVDKTAKR